MRVIGIDPGTICCGYGIVDAVSTETRDKRQETNSETRDERQETSKYNNSSLVTRHSSLEKSLVTRHSSLLYIASGEIKVNKRDALAERLNLLYHSLKKIIDEYKPSHIALEKIFFSKSIQSAFALGSMRGVAMLLAAQSSTPVFEYNPTELKQAVVGYGRAEKRQVKEMVRVILEIKEDLTENGADALALCICHINSVDRLKYVK
ncbi:MAG: crossover junction endodeoxyribonuclease RuvC [Nitrospirae bacterium]|nr:crossover junction endodeoxyribonuclease RuvC [Nitrospirota bacterium]